MPFSGRKSTVGHSTAWEGGCLHLLVPVYVISTARRQWKGSTKVCERRRITIKNTIWDKPMFVFKLKPFTEYFRKIQGEECLFCQEILLSLLPNEFLWAFYCYSESQFRWRDKVHFYLMLELPYLFKIKGQIPDLNVAVQIYCCFPGVWKATNAYTMSIMLTAILIFLFSSMFHIHSTH